MGKNALKAPCGDNQASRMLEKRHTQKCVDSKQKVHLFLKNKTDDSGKRFLAKPDFLIFFPGVDLFFPKHLWFISLPTHWIFYSKCNYLFHTCKVLWFSVCSGTDSSMSSLIITYSCSQSVKPGQLFLSNFQKLECLNLVMLPLINI